MEREDSYSEVAEEEVPEEKADTGVIEQSEKVEDAPKDDKPVESERQQIDTQVKKDPVDEILDVDDTNKQEFDM